MTTSQVNRLSQEALELGKKKLDFLIADLCLLTTLNLDRPGRDLVRAIKKCSERDLLALTVLHEMEGLQPVATSLRDMIIRDAGEFLARDFGMSRRHFFRTTAKLSGGATALAHSELSLTRIFFSPETAEFSLTKIVGQIIEGVNMSVRGVTAFQVGLMGLKPLGDQRIPPEIQRQFSLSVPRLTAAIKQDPAITIGMQPGEFAERIVAHAGAYRDLFDQAISAAQKKAVELGWLGNDLSVEGLVRRAYPELDDFFDNTRAVYDWERDLTSEDTMDEHWPIAWLGVKEGFYGTEVTFHNRLRLPFVDDLDYDYTLP